MEPKRPIGNNMTRILITFLFILASCSTKNNTEWTNLFDGKTVNGLRGYKMETFPWGAWEIIDGSLMSIPCSKSSDIIFIYLF